jgi:hypothetical protein
MWFKRKHSRVKLTGRAGIIYCDQDGRTMHVDSEMLAGKEFDIVIYLDSIKKWQPPHETEPVSDSDRDLIKTDIARELNNLRIDWQ